MCMCGVVDDFSVSVPSLASVSAISFLVMHDCACTLCTWIMCGVQYISCTMAAMSNLSGWWCWDVGCYSTLGYLT